MNWQVYATAVRANFNIGGRAGHRPRVTLALLLSETFKKRLTLSREGTWSAQGIERQEESQLLSEMWITESLRGPNKATGRWKILR